MKVTLDLPLSIAGLKIEKSDKVTIFFLFDSDGCGRTGTYMCIDANLEFADEDNMYDVFGYTKKMRQARKGMIETVVSC